MKIGVIADTHDNQESVAAAVEFFNSEGAEHVLHAGDLVSPFTASKFEDLKAKLHYVWGNNEGAREHVRRNLERIGTEVYGNFASLKLDGCKIAMLHGEHEEVVEALAESDRYDVVVRGHTHDPGVDKKKMVINPGPASGYLQDNRTVALLDTEDLEAEIMEI
ncbi:MAG: metallophosphoesterase [Candidatus Hadarchaeota archaeon]